MQIINKMICNDSINTIFGKPNNDNSTMKRYKVREILKMLTSDGWYIAAQRGSHRQFKHNKKKGKVTVNGKPNETMDQVILNNIFKQARWK